MSGPSNWTDPIVYSGGFWFSGTIINNGFMNPISISRAPGGVGIPMLDQTDVTQLQWFGGNKPLGPNGPITMSWEVQFYDNNTDYRLIQEAADIGEPVDMWFDKPLTDVWWIPGNHNGQLWKTSRQLPYGLVTGINTTTRPPKAWLVTQAGAEQSQTIVTGTPSAGEVKIENTNGYYEVETPSLDGGTYKFLKVFYHPILLVKVLQFEETYLEHNDLRFILEIQEVRGGIYSLGSG